MEALAPLAAVRRAPIRPRALRALTLAALLSLALPVLGGEPPPGTNVASIRSWLLAHNPELRAMQADADAAQARVLPAGALPDPMIGFRLEGIDTRSPSLLPGDVDMATYSIRQTFPLWGKRELARGVARGQADAMRLERDAQARALMAEAEQAYVRYWHADEGLRVIDRLITLLAQVEDVARERYALGIAAQQDAIRAQVARTRMQGERIERVSMRHEAVVQLNASLGRSADAPLAQPTTEPAITVPAASLTEGMAALRDLSHPAIRARQAVAEAADRTEHLQRRQRYPDLSVSVGAMQQGSRLDGYELMLEIEIPLQRRALHEREREARLLGEAARARVEAMEVALQSRLGEAWARWASSRDRRQLFAQTLLPQTEANFESALSSYRVGDVDFATLLEALEAWQGADLSRVDALRDELSGAAAVRALIGSTP